MRSRLAARGLEDDVAAAVIDELLEQGYLDDARYARRFAEDRRTLDGWGPERIERRLAAVGVGAADIVAALGGRDGEDELAAAVEVLRRRRLPAPEDDRARERMLGVLVRKGFALEMAYDAVRAYGRDAS
jgi:regulatory protein